MREKIENEEKKIENENDRGTNNQNWHKNEEE